MTDWQRYDSDEAVEARIQAGIAILRESPLARLREFMSWTLVCEDEATQLFRDVTRAVREVPYDIELAGLILDAIRVVDALIALPRPSLPRQDNDEDEPRKMLEIQAIKTAIISAATIGHNLALRTGSCTSRCTLRRLHLVEACLVRPNELGGWSDYESSDDESSDDEGDDNHGPPPLASDDEGDDNHGPPPLAISSDDEGDDNHGPPPLASQGRSFHDLDPPAGLPLASASMPRSRSPRRRSRSPSPLAWPRLRVLQRPPTPSASMSRARSPRRRSRSRSRLAWPRRQAGAQAQAQVQVQDPTPDSDLRWERDEAAELPPQAQAQARWERPHLRWERVLQDPPPDSDDVNPRWEREAAEPLPPLNTWFLFTEVDEETRFMELRASHPPCARYPHGHTTSTYVFWLSNCVDPFPDEERNPPPRRELEVDNPQTIIGPDRRVWYPRRAPMTIFIPDNDNVNGRVEYEMGFVEGYRAATLREEWPERMHTPWRESGINAWLHGGWLRRNVASRI